MTYHSFDLTPISISFDEKNGSPTARCKLAREEINREMYKLLERLQSEGKIDLYT